MLIATHRFATQEMGSYFVSGSNHLNLPSELIEFTCLKFISDRAKCWQALRRGHVLVCRA